VDGAEAADWRMIHRAVPAADVDAAAAELVATFAGGATVALGLSKWLLHTAATSGLDEQLRNEAFAMELSSRSEDFREGLKAFQEKRAPDYGGR
jgi:2-(1,2-epoxy-1,2-dihydrophenyl)acetyl-CoA isomerase